MFIAKKQTKKNRVMKKFNHFLKQLDTQFAPNWVPLSINDIQLQMSVATFMFSLHSQYLLQGGVVRVGLTAVPCFCFL